MSTGTTVDGKPVQAGDQVTVIGSVVSVSYPNITVKLLQSAANITAHSAFFDGPSSSGAGHVVDGAVVADQVSGRGVVTSVSGSGALATLAVLFTDPNVSGVASATVNVQARDCYASQSL
jgi:hypothetical protein